MSIQFRYFTGADAEAYTFYRIPKALFTQEVFKGLSCESKVLYGLMLDRVSLSVRNGWKDENDRVYIIYPVAEICDQLGCARQKVFKLLSELDTKTGIGLIERVRRGLGMENLIYVRNFIIDDKTTAEPEGGEEEKDRTVDLDQSAEAANEKQKYENHISASPADRKEKIDSSTGMPEAQKYENHTSGSMKKSKDIPAPQKYENHTTGSMKIIRQEVPKSYGNKTDNNKTKKSDTELSIHPISPSTGTDGRTVSMDGMIDMTETQEAYQAVIDELRDKCGYEVLCTSYAADREYLDGILAIMADQILSSRKSITISGERIPMWKVKKRLRDIDMLTMQYVLDSLANNRSQVKNIKKYLIATLINAPTTIQTYYQQAVNALTVDFTGK